MRGAQCWLYDLPIDTGQLDSELLGLSLRALSGLASSTCSYQSTNTAMLLEVIAWLLEVIAWKTSDDISGGSKDMMCFHVRTTAII